MKAHIVRRERQDAGGRVKARSYFVVVEVGRDPNTGKRRQKWHHAGSTKAEADALYSTLLGRVSSGTYVPPSDLTVGDYLDAYLASQKKRLGQVGKKGMSHTTWAGYERIIKHHLRPNLGHLKLTDLSNVHIEAYEEEMLSGGWAHGGKDGHGLSPTTVLQHHGLLGRALKLARRDGKITSNPIELVDPPGRAQHQPVYLDEEQAAALLELVAGSPLELPVKIALATGMRCGELCGLRRADVDLGPGVLCVERTVIETEGKRREKPPKSKTGRRAIDLDPLTAAALRAEFDGRKVRRLRGDEYVCLDAAGQPLSPGWLSGAFRSFSKKHKLGGLRFHDLRHTHASLLAKAGVHPKVVQERLGHSSIQVTLDLYSHFFPSMQAEAATKIGEMLYGKAVEGN